MSESSWITALGTLDWTAIIVAALGGGGAITIYLQDRRRRRRKDDTDDETPQDTGSVSATYDPQALKMARQALDLTEGLSKQLTATKARLDAVETELSLFRRSYKALYEWAQQKIIGNWQAVRLEGRPPPLPPDIHHPHH